jgi:transposase
MVYKTIRWYIKQYDGILQNHTNKSKKKNKKNEKKTKHVIEMLVSHNRYDFQALCYYFFLDLP